MSDDAIEWAISFNSALRFWFTKILTPVFGGIGIIGNVVTIIVLTRKRMKSSTNSYLCALAVSDLIFIILNLFLCVQQNEYMRSVDYRIYWELFPYAIWLNDATCGMSVWLTVSFTLERYVAVCHPLRGKVICTESRARKVIAAVVIFCLLSTVSTCFEWDIKFSVINNTTHPVQYSDFGKNETYKTIFYGFSSFTYVFVPFCMLAVLNWFLISAVRKSQRQRNNLTEDYRGVSGSLKSPSRKNSSIVKMNQANSTASKRMTVSRRLYREKQENKITLALTSVVCMFLVCQTPQTIMLFVQLFHSTEKGTFAYEISYGIHNICNFLVLVNAACNFILYCAMSDKYRQTLIMTFFPSRAYRHARANTLSSLASFRNSSMAHTIQTTDEDL